MRYRHPVTGVPYRLTHVQAEHLRDMVDGLGTELEPPLSARVLTTLHRRGLAEVQLGPYRRGWPRDVIAKLTPFGRRVLVEYRRTHP